MITNDVRTLLGRYLSAWLHQNEANGGDEMPWSATLPKFNLVILDIMMPGTPLAEPIKSRKRTEHAFGGLNAAVMRKTWHGGFGLELGGRWLPD